MLKSKSIETFTNRFCIDFKSIQFLSSASSLSAKNLYNVTTGCISDDPISVSKEEDWDSAIVAETMNGNVTDMKLRILMEAAAKQVRDDTGM